MWVPEAIGIDPDLCWDDAGQCYLTWKAMDFTDGEGGILQGRLDPVTGSVPRTAVSGLEGSGLGAAEGPHLYAVNGYWYPGPRRRRHRARPRGDHRPQPPRVRAVRGVSRTTRSSAIAAWSIPSRTPATPTSSSCRRRVGRRLSRRPPQGLHARLPRPGPGDLPGRGGLGRRLADCRRGPLRGASGRHGLRRPVPERRARSALGGARR